jgi:uncharacterized protein
MKERSVPIRSCIACRTSGNKIGLVRVVRTPAGDVSVDATGKMAGRGAYLCASPQCLSRAIKEKRLSRALRIEVPPETYRELENTVKQGSQDM